MIRNSVFSKIGWVNTLIIMCLSIPLIAHMYNGGFIRFVADDYCTISIGMEHGFLRAPLIWYTTWSGLFTNFMIKSAIAPLGPGFSGILPTLILLLWLVVGIWTAFQIVSVLRVQRPALTACLFGLLVVYATVDSAPTVGQSVYWTGGNIPYTLPIILMTGYIGFLIRTLRQPDVKITPGAVFIAAVIPFLSGGLSETYVTLQITALMVTAALCYSILTAKRRRVALLLLAISFVAACLAMMVIIVAPGNAVRQSNFGSTTSLLELFILSLRTTASYTASALAIFAPTAMIIGLTLGAFIALRAKPLKPGVRLYPQRVRRLLALSAALCCFLIMSSFVPALYALGFAPPGRVYIIPNFILVCTAVFWGSLIGFTIQLKQPAQFSMGAEKPTIGVIGVAITLILVLGSLFSTWKALSLSLSYASAAAAWDRQDAEIKTAAQQGVSLIIVKKPDITLDELLGLQPMGADSTVLRNQCAADYYGIEALVVESPTQAVINQ